MADNNIRNRLRSNRGSTSSIDGADSSVKPKTTPAPSNKPKTGKSSKSKRSQPKTEPQYCPTKTEKDNPKLLVCPCEDDGPDTNGLWWSACSKCQQWWHNKCAGIEDCNQESNDFVCILCCIDSIKSETVKRKICKKITSQASPIPCDSQSTKPKVEQAEKLESNIVILDNISSIKDYHNSSQIKSEVNRCKPKLDIQQAYSLPRGGIALHLKSQKDTEEALKPWPQSFGSQVSPHRPSRHLTQSHIIVRSVKTRHSQSEITSDLTKTYPNSGPITVRRLHHRHTKLPLPLIELTCANKTAANWLNAGVNILGSHHKVEPKRRFRVVRCYHCQSFGHVAKNCNNPAVCRQCGTDHPDMLNCTMPAKCANCHDPHPADSKHCPVYAAVVTKLHYNQ